MKTSIYPTSHKAYQGKPVSLFDSDPQTVREKLGYQKSDIETNARKIIKDIPNSRNLTPKLSFEKLQDLSKGYIYEPDKKVFEFVMNDLKNIDEDFSSKNDGELKDFNEIFSKLENQLLEGNKKVNLLGASTPQGFFKKAYQSSQDISKNLRGQLLQWSLMRYGDKDARDILARRSDFIEDSKTFPVRNEEEFNNMFDALTKQTWVRNPLSNLKENRYSKYENPLFNKLFNKIVNQKLDYLKGDVEKTLEVDQSKLSITLPKDLTEAIKSFAGMGRNNYEFLVSNPDPSKQRTTLIRERLNPDFIKLKTGAAVLDLDLKTNKLTSDFKIPLDNLTEEDKFKLIYQQLTDGVNALANYVTKTPQAGGTNGVFTAFDITHTEGSSISMLSNSDETLRTFKPALSKLALAKK
ncbi:MAG: hypothetical protein HRT47_12735 [Candidatus Caenarcaniphilales bacterium]|nr:hypothetical protein [Candidatus Caenarcaniphilales bacterium]